MPRLFLFLTLCSALAFSQTPQYICDASCEPNPQYTGYNNTVAARTSPKNGRGTSSPYSPKAPGTGAQDALTGTSVIGSESYDWETPLLYLPGRNGLDVDLRLHYNSHVWTIDKVNNEVTFNEDRDFPSYGFRIGYGFIEKLDSSDYILTESDNTKRVLAQSSPGIFDSTDNSYIRLYSGSLTLQYKNGVTVTYGNFPNQDTDHPRYRPLEIKDTNGNRITIAYRSDTWAKGQEIDTVMHPTQTGHNLKL